MNRDIDKNINKEGGVNSDDFSNNDSQKLEKKTELNDRDKRVKKSINPRGVRTYRDYAISALSGKPTSLAKMIIKEKKKQEFNYEYSPKNKKNISMMILSGILVLLGVGAVAAIMIFVIKKEEEISINSVSISPKSIVYFDYKDENMLGNRSSLKDVFLRAIKQTVIPIGDVKIFYFVKKNTANEKILANTSEIIETMDTRASGQFIRNLKDEYSIGVLSTSSGAEPFMLLKFRDFDATFPAISAWEKTMLVDMGDIFNVNRKYYSQKFEDLFLHNKDSKVILDENGKIVFGYSFLDANTLLFFTDNITYKAILSSMKKNRERT